jgi:imidazolonepropionase-like amidohydrolase
MRRFLLNTAAAAAALVVAGPALAETVAITNAHIHTLGAQGEIAKGTLVLRDGKIAAVGANVQVPQGARVIDAKGGVVTPGLTASDSGLGAVEVGAVGNDLTVNSPDVSAAFDVQYGLNPDSVLIPVARMGGITRAVVTPEHPGARDGEHKDDTAGAGDGRTHSRSLFAGKAAVIELGQGTDLLVKANVAMVAPLGDTGADVAGGARGAEFVRLKAVFDDVRHFQQNRAAYDRGESRDLGLSRSDLEALIPVVEGRMPLILSVSRASDIRQALKLAREERLKVVLDGVEEGWLVADDIAKAGVPVILNPLADLPESFEALGSNMENAARLNAAGVTVIIKSAEGGAHRARETRYDAGSAVAHGMPWEAALKAVTVNPAKVFGFADRYGTLEPGKDADVVVWTGDPFEPLSRPVAVFVQGREQPLTSRQIQLGERYRDVNTAYPPAYH